MIIDLETAKGYLRVDYDEENNFIQLCIDQAEQYLRDAIEDFDIKLEQEEFISKCKIPMLLLIQTMYDNRNFKESKKESERINYIVSSFMMQLQYCYDIEETI